MGRRSVFLRLSGCNLMCGGQGTQFDGELHNGATWRCDTVEVWMKGQAKPFEEVLPAECMTALQNGARLIITGGEPLMHQETLVPYLRWLRQELQKNFVVEVETNGTVMPSNGMMSNVNLWNCSPKLSNSGNVKEVRCRPDVISRLSGQYQNAIFKFVVSREEDWEEIEQDYLPHILDREQVWLMPAGENRELLEQNKQKTVALALAQHVNFCDRLHIEIWNQKTGV